MGLRRLGFVVLLFALAAAPLVALGWVAVSFSTTAVKDEARKGAFDAATVVAVVIDGRLTDTTNNLHGYAQAQLSAALATGDPTDLEAATSAVINLPHTIDGFREAVFTDADGHGLANSTGSPSVHGQDFSGLEWFPPVVATGRPYITGAVTDDRGHWVVWIAVPIFYHDRLAGILAGAYDVENMQEDTLYYAESLGMSLTFVDQRGQAVMVTQGEPRMMAQDPRIQASFHGHGGVVDQVVNGQLVFSAYAPVHNLDTLSGREPGNCVANHLRGARCAGSDGWTVIADVPQAAPLARIDGLVVAVGLIGGILLVILLVCVIFGMSMHRRSIVGEREAESLIVRVLALQRIDAAARAVHTDHGAKAFHEIIEAARELAAGEAAGLVLTGTDGGAPAELTVGTGGGKPAAATTRLDGPVAAAIETRTVASAPDLVAVPLVSGERSIGALTVAGPGIGARLDGEDFALLNQLAQHAVTAVQSQRYDREREGLLSELRDQYEQLNEANRLKSEFLASMSHELRTPLSAVIGFADLLIDGIDGELNPDQREDVAQIRTSGRSLLELINEILDLSKIEAGKMALELADVDLAEAVDLVCASIRPLAVTKQLGLDSEVPAGVTVHGDPQRIRQVLTNLVANAVKFTAKGGVVIRCEAGATEVRVEVTDTGIGIAPETQGIVFEEFRQAEAGTTRTYGGTGLGLAIAKALVELQGGHIGLESEVGVGSSFWFTLPLSKPLGGKAYALAGPGAAIVTLLTPRTRDIVLVVDDEPATRRVIVRRLQESGFHTEEAASAEAALRLARELHPAAITLDVIMPEANGWRVLTELKRDPATADIPVVVVSILDGREVALEMGASAFLSKPFRKSELIGAVRGALGRLDGADVLCVDDERASRELVRRTLGSAGVRVRTVASGARALEEVRSHLPDAVCVDLMMPDMNGFELVSRLRELKDMRRVPIIVISAKELDRDDVESLSGNVERFINKAGMQAGDLCATVRQTIQWSQESTHAV
ncbi:MAG: response regulator [Chloroflexota bacterium]